MARPFARMNDAPKIGPTVVASELNACASVKRLGALAGVARARRERIGGHLHDRDAGRQDEQRPQKSRINPRIGGRGEQQAAQRHQQQADRCALQIPDAAVQPSGGKRDEEIGAEEAELRQHHFGIGQRECRFEFGNDGVDQDRAKPEGEEQRHHQPDDAGRAALAIGRPIRDQHDRAPAKVDRRRATAPAQPRRDSGFPRVARSPP